MWLQPSIFSAGVRQPGQNFHPRCVMRWLSSLLPSHEWAGPLHSIVTLHILHHTWVQPGIGQTIVFSASYSSLSTKTACWHLIERRKWMMKSNHQKIIRPFEQTFDNVVRSRTKTSAIRCKARTVSQSVQSAGPNAYPTLENRKVKKHTNLRFERATYFRD